MKKILVVVNKRKLYGKRKSLFEKVILRLKKLSYDIVIHSITSDADESKTLSKEFLTDETISYLMVAGGDGFLNIILQSWQRQDIPIAFIPLGTCNLFATECGYTKNADQIVQIIQQANLIPFYCGKINDHLFTVTAGYGLDSKMLQAVNWKWKRYLGKFYLAFLISKELLKQKRETLLVSIDGNPPIEVSTIIFGKGRYYSGNFIFAPLASISNTYFYLLLYKRKSFWHEMKILYYFFRNKIYKEKSVSILRAQEIDILNPSGQPLQLDGDIRTVTPAKISIDNKKFLVCAARQTVIKD
jgi:diacylglycerol kinase (ATP)